MVRHTYMMPWIKMLLGLTLISTLSACQGNQSNQASTVETNVSPASTASVALDETTTSQTAQEHDGDATISAVETPSVWVKTTAEADQPAQTGMSMAYGDTIRTDGEGLAQVDLDNGLAFRIGSNAALTLQPDNRLSLQSGEMLTWVEPGQQAPTEITTPAGIAGLRGTTLFIQIPPDSNDEILFLSWEGTIRLQVVEGAEDILLQSGEALRVRPGEQDVEALRQRVRRLGRREIRQRRGRSRLLNRFQRQLPTHEQIEATLESAP